VTPRPVSSLDRLVWPRDGITKGALMRYYARVAPALNPLLRDRPLVLECHPRGVAGPSFHQHVPGESAPPSVRTAEVETEDGEVVPRLVGGDLVGQCLDVGLVVRFGGELRVVCHAGR